MHPSSLSPCSMYSKWRHMRSTTVVNEPTEMWEKWLISKAPTISYWMTVRDYLFINCRFVRDQQVGDRPLTLNACYDMYPCFFFGFWGHKLCPLLLKRPILIKDPSISPPGFHGGKVCHSTWGQKVSMMRLKQTHEHSIKFLKKDSEAKGLYGQQEMKEVLELS